MSYLIVVNPLSKSKGQKALKNTLEFCSVENIPAQVFQTTGSFESDYQSIQSQLSQFSKVIVIGGDGLIHLVANVLVGTKIPMLIIPAGSGNDFAKHLYGKLRCDIPKLLKAQSKPVSLISINERYCINVAGVGFDVYLLSKLTPKLKRHFGSFAYVICAFRCLFSYQAHKIQIKHETSWQSFNPLLMVFALGKFFGGGMQINPQGVLGNQSCFKLIKCEQKGILFTLKALIYLLFSQHFRLSSIIVSNHQALEIKSDQNFMLDIDGELVKFPKNESVKLKLIKDAIQVVQY